MHMSEVPVEAEDGVGSPGTELQVVFSHPTLVLGSTRAMCILDFRVIFSSSLEAGLTSPGWYGSLHIS